MLLKPFSLGRVRVHIWTLILFVVALLMDFGALLFVAYLIAALHELAHIFVAGRCGAKTEYIEILPFGITMHLNKNIIISNRDEIKIALGGPLFNLLTAFFAYGFYTWPYREYVISLSLAMGVFNLLPALPLDGGRILRGILACRVGDIRAASIVINLTGYISVGIIVFGIYLLWASGFNFSVLLCGAFLAANLTEERKNINRIIMKDIIYSRKKLENGGMYECGVIVADLGQRAMGILKMLSHDRYYVINVVDSRLNVIKTITETRLIEAMALYGVNVSMKKIVEI